MPPNFCLCLQLNLSNNNIGAYWNGNEWVSTPEGPKAIADALRVNGSVTECNLRDNNLKEEGWCAIFDALRDNPQSKIAKWDLNGQGITPAIVKSLAAYVAVSGSVTSVRWTPGHEPSSLRAACHVCCLSMPF